VDRGIELFAFLNSTAMRVEEDVAGISEDNGSIKVYMELVEI
jgi:hypothetical protein